MCMFSIIFSMNGTTTEIYRLIAADNETNEKSQVVDSRLIFQIIWFMPFKSVELSKMKRLANSMRVALPQSEGSVCL